MKRFFNLPIYLKIIIGVLTAVSVLILAFNWPTPQKELPFRNPNEISSYSIAPNLNQFVLSENIKIDENKKKEEAAAKEKAQAAAPKAATPAPKPPLYTGAHIRFGYLYDPNLIDSINGGINVASPGWFSLKSDGSIIDNASISTVNAIHAKGITVVPFINAYSGNSLAPLLQSPDSRNKLVSDIIAKVTKYNVEGINIDFEDPAITKDSLNAFMQELSARLHSIGKISTIAVNAKTTKEESWLARFDYPFLGQVTDYVIIMAYDEHYRGSAPGPVSSLGWFKDVATYAAKTIPRNKIVMGIPLYGRHWINGTGGTGVSYSYIINNLLAPTGAAASWDPVTGVPFARYNAADGLHEIFFENPQSVQIKANEVINNGFLGAAFWRLGQEDLNVWPVVKNTLK